MLEELHCLLRLGIGQHAEQQSTHIRIGCVFMARVVHLQFSSHRL